MKKICIFLNLIFLNVFALAEEELFQSQENADLILKNTYTPNYLGMIFGLLLIICLIYLTAIIYQKLLKVKFIQQNSNANCNMQIVNSIQIGQNQKVSILKVGNEHLLIGSTQNNITMLKKLEIDVIKE